MVSFDERSSENGFWLNALIGGVVALVLGFVPFSPVLGGIVSSYLQRSTDRTENLKIGAAAGLVVMIPGFLLAIFVFGVVGLFGVVGGAGGARAGILVFLLFAMVVAALAAVYTVGLSALGGLLGHVIWEDDFERDRRGREAESTPGNDESRYGSDFD
ncbi:DUF5518 domain-containing protein [Haloarchaeobius sp. TZWWS8]|uniref:DUF5518 domain-containing protein n=1 Tax=Haloarchaeobius sp. TZWWS8 TaxID=3446121 RepID=UPI003EBED36B